MLLVTWTGCVHPTQVLKPGGAACSPPGCLSFDSPLKQLNCSPYFWMKTAWLLAHSTPAFTGLLTLSFTLSSRSLTRGGLCLTSAQSWISLYVEEQASSFHLIHPHTTKGKSSASQKGRLLPFLTPLDPYSHPLPTFPHSAQWATFPFFVIIGEPWDWHPDFCSSSAMGARPPLPDFQRPSPVHPLQFTLSSSPSPGP